MDGPLGRVHTGFYHALQDIWPQMQTRIGQLRSDDRDNARPQRPLWITGHSLGAAMATLAAAELIMRDEPFYGGYTFGSPRCGDRDLRVFLTRRLPADFFDSKTMLTSLHGCLPG